MDTANPKTGESEAQVVYKFLLGEQKIVYRYENYNFISWESKGHKEYFLKFEINKTSWFLGDRGTKGSILEVHF